MLVVRSRSLQPSGPVRRRSRDARRCSSAMATGWRSLGTKQSAPPAMRCVACAAMRARRAWCIRRLRTRKVSCSRELAARRSAARISIIACASSISPIARARCHSKCRWPDIEKADAIVLIGCNPRNELPLLNARMRKAVEARREGLCDQSASISPHLSWPASASLRPANGRCRARSCQCSRRSDSNSASSALSNAIGERNSTISRAIWLKALSAAGSSVFIVGEMATAASACIVAARCSCGWSRRKAASAYNEIPLGANAVGLAQVGALPEGDGLDARAMCAAARKRYVLYGFESPHDFADGAPAGTLLRRGSRHRVLGLCERRAEAGRQRHPADRIAAGNRCDADQSRRASSRVARRRQTAGRCAAGLESVACARWIARDSTDLDLPRSAKSAFADVANRAADIAARSQGWCAELAGIAVRQAAWPEAIARRLTTTAIYRNDASRAPCACAERASAQRAVPRVALHPEDALALGIGGDATGDGRRCRVAGRDHACGAARQRPGSNRVTPKPTCCRRTAQLSTSQGRRRGHSVIDACAIAARSRRHRSGDLDRAQILALPCR